MVNGQHLYSASSSTLSTQSTLHYSFTFTHSHTHTCAYTHRMMAVTQSTNLPIRSNAGYFLHFTYISILPRDTWTSLKATACSLFPKLQKVSKKEVLRHLLMPPHLSEPCLNHIQLAHLQNAHAYEWQEQIHCHTEPLQQQECIELGWNWTLLQVAF